MKLFGVGELSQTQSYPRKTPVLRSRRPPRGSHNRHVPGKEAEFQRRMSFYEQANWSAIEDLMRGAGLLTKQGHDVERTGTGGREGGKAALTSGGGARERGGNS